MKNAEPPTTLESALASVHHGWTWELRRFWNHPWAVQYVFVLRSPHDEPEIKTYGMTPAEAVMQAVHAAQISRMRAALERSIIAIDDWLALYASDLVAHVRVQQATERVSSFGTVAYIAEVQAQNRAALDSKSDGSAVLVNQLVGNKVI